MLARHCMSDAGVKMKPLIPLVSFPVCTVESCKLSYLYSRMSVIQNRFQLSKNPIIYSLRKGHEHVKLLPHTHIVCNFYYIFMHLWHSFGDTIYM